MNLKDKIRQIIKEELSKLNFNPHKYNSFSNLTEQDLYNIAKWGLMNDFDSSGAWDCGDSLEEAAKCTVDGFKNLLKDKYPDGFNGVPNELTIYRMIALEDQKDFNKTKLGYSWFTNPNRIDNPDFKQQMWHLKTRNLYLITAKTAESNIDIPRSLFQRDMVWLENEVVVKDDSPSKIKIISLDKI